MNRLSPLVLLLGLCAAPLAPADQVRDTEPAPAPAAAAAADTGTAGDADFFRKAAEGGMAEVELGKLGAQMATHPDVRAFSDQMVRDHTAANDKLKALAAKKGVTLPAGPSADQQKAIADIRAKKGDEFDEHLMKQMVADHDDAVDLFERTAKSGADADVRNFASQTLPTLKHHEKMADEIEEKVD